MSAQAKERGDDDASTPMEVDPSTSTNHTKDKPASSSSCKTINMAVRQCYRGVIDYVIPKFREVAKNEAGYTEEEAARLAEKLLQLWTANLKGGALKVDIGETTGIGKETGKVTWTTPAWPRQRTSLCRAAIRPPPSPAASPAADGADAAGSAAATKPLSSRPALGRPSFFMAPPSLDGPKATVSTASRRLSSTTPSSTKAAAAAASSSASKPEKGGRGRRKSAPSTSAAAPSATTAKAPAAAAIDNKPIRTYVARTPASASQPKLLGKRITSPIAGPPSLAAIGASSATTAFTSNQIQIPPPAAKKAKLASPPLATLPVPPTSSTPPLATASAASLPPTSTTAATSPNFRAMLLGDEEEEEEEEQGGSSATAVVPGAVPAAAEGGKRGGKAPDYSALLLADDDDEDSDDEEDQASTSTGAHGGRSTRGQGQLSASDLDILLGEGGLGGEEEEEEGGVQHPPSARIVRALTEGMTEEEEGEGEEEGVTPKGGGAAAGGAARSSTSTGSGEIPATNGQPHIVVKTTRPRQRSLLLVPWNTFFDEEITQQEGGDASGRSGEKGELLLPLPPLLVPKDETKGKEGAAEGEGKRQEEEEGKEKKKEKDTEVEDDLGLPNEAHEDPKICGRLTKLVRKEDVWVLRMEDCFLMTAHQEQFLSRVDATIKHNL